MCIYEEETFLSFGEIQSYIKDKTEIWEIEGKDFTIVDFSEMLLDTLCEYLYEKTRIDDELRQDEFKKDLSIYFKAEFFKRQVKTKKKKVDTTKFVENYKKFQENIIAQEVRGDKVKKLKNILMRKRPYSHQVKNFTESSQNFFEYKRGEEFFNHYIKGDEISEYALPLYMILFTIYLFAKESEDKEIIKYYQVLLGYRKKTPVKKEVQEVIKWSVECYAELYFSNYDIIQELNCIATISGINNYLEEFNFYTVTVKHKLWSFLLSNLKYDDKESLLDDPFSFMVYLMLDSLETEKPLLGKFGKEQKKNTEKVVRYMSTDYRSLKRYLDDYFGKELKREIEYGYFSLDVPEDKLEELEWEIKTFHENQLYNQLISYIFLRLNLPKDNYISICEGKCSFEYIFKKIQEINSSVECNKKSVSGEEIRERVYIDILDVIEEVVKKVKEILDNTEILEGRLLEILKKFLKSGKLVTSKSFIKKLESVDKSFVEKIEGEEIRWNFTEDIDDLLMKIYLRMFI